MPTQNHVHLQALSGAAESGKFYVRQGTLDDTPLVPLIVDRALDTTPYFHRTLDSVGNIKSIPNHSFMVLCTSRAELDSLIALVGKHIYYIPHDHGDEGDSSGHTTARQPVVLALRPNSVTNLDTAMQYWVAGVDLHDD